MRLSQPSAPPGISSIFLLIILVFFLSAKFSYLREDKNSPQLVLISLKISLVSSKRSLTQQGALDINTGYIYIRLKKSSAEQTLIRMVMEKKKIWLDCDPGHDDMLAIIMAALSDNSHLIGISTSAGNSFIENTTQNALNILHQIGRPDIPVIKGSPGPLCGKLEVAPTIHGVSGLEGAILLQSGHRAIEQKPFLEIYQRVMSFPQKIEFVVTGAMTNLAILLRAFPDIKEQLNGITIMGGAIGLGNWSPAAEFNILVDPEAASIVFSQGLPLTMIPLQVTHTVAVTEEIFGEFDALSSSFGKKLTPLFRYFQKMYKQSQDFDYPLAHDPCTIHYLLHPQDFSTRKAFVEIELQGKSRGRTNCHFMHHILNAIVCEKINVANFWKAMLTCLRKIK